MTVTKNDLLTAKENSQKVKLFLERKDVQAIVNELADTFAQSHNVCAKEFRGAGMEGVIKAVQDYKSTEKDMVGYLEKQIWSAMTRQLRSERPSKSTVSLFAPTDKEGNLHVINGIQEQTSGVNEIEIKLDVEKAITRLENELQKKIFLALLEGHNQEEIISSLGCDSEDIETVRRLTAYILEQQKEMSAQEAKAKLAGKRGFIVEDDEEFVRPLIEDFKRLNVELEWRQYGLDAARALADARKVKNFHFVLVDLILPRYSGSEKTPAVGEELLKLIQNNPDVPPGLILSSVLSLYKNPVQYNAEKIFEWVFKLSARGFRFLPKQPDTLIEGQWKYDFGEICKALAAILRSEPSGILIETAKGLLRITAERIYWIPNEKLSTLNKSWRKINDKKFEIDTKPRERELLSRFRRVGSRVDYRDVDEIIRKYARSPGKKINMTRARITLFHVINSKLKGTGLQIKAIRKDAIELIECKRSCGQEPPSE